MHNTLERCTPVTKWRWMGAPVETTRLSSCFRQKEPLGPMKKASKTATRRCCAPCSPIQTQLTVMMMGRWREPTPLLESMKMHHKMQKTLVSAHLFIYFTTVLCTWSALKSCLSLCVCVQTCHWTLFAFQSLQTSWAPTRDALPGGWHVQAEPPSPFYPQHTLWTCVSTLKNHPHICMCHRFCTLPLCSHASHFVSFRWSLYRYDHSANTLICPIS